MLRVAPGPETEARALRGHAGVAVPAGVFAGVLAGARGCGRVVSLMVTNP